MSYYFQGLAVALTAIMPIGVQNLFVINSAMALPRPRALLVALIVTGFDMSLTLAAFFGMGALMERFPAVRSAVLLIGGLAVIKIGAGLLRSGGANVTGRAEALAVSRLIARAFVVTWFNPQALLDTTLFFGAFRASLPTAAVTPFVSGCLSASPLWFVSVCLIISACRARIGPKLLRGLNAVCGAAIVFYGCRLLWSFFAAKYGL